MHNLMKSFIWSSGRHEKSHIEFLSNISEKNLFLPPLSGEGLLSKSPERETGANPVQYPLLWVPPKEPQNVTVVRREGAVPGTSQKTCHGALLSLREVGGYKRGPNRALRSILTEAFCRTWMLRIMHLRYFFTNKFMPTFLRPDPLFTDHFSLITIKP